MASLIAAVVTLPLLADLVTAQRAQETNPLALALMDQPLLMFAAKVAEIAIVISVVTLLRPKRPAMAYRIVALAMLAGLIGAISNVT